MMFSTAAALHVCCLPWNCFIRCVPSGAIHDAALPRCCLRWGAPARFFARRPPRYIQQCCFRLGAPACFLTRRPPSCFRGAASSGATRRAYPRGVFHHTFGGAASDGAPQRATHAAPSAVLPAVLLQAGRPGVLPHAAFSTVMKQLQPQQLQLGV